MKLKKIEFLLDVCLATQFENVPRRPWRNDNAFLMLLFVHIWWIKNKPFYQRWLLLSSIFFLTDFIRKCQAKEKREKAEKESELVPMKKKKIFSIQFRIGTFKVSTKESNNVDINFRKFHNFCHEYFTAFTISFFL